MLASLNYSFHLFLSLFFLSVQWARSLFLIFVQYRSDHKFIQTRWEVCLSKVISSLPSCPALAHQICCNYVFTLDLAFFWFKGKVFGAEARWPHPRRILILLPVDISQKTHMTSRGNDLSHIHLHQCSITSKVLF